MASITAHKFLEVAPRSKTPLGAWAAVAWISGPSNSKMAFLARLAERVVDSLTEAGFPVLGARHPDSVSTREKTDLDNERAWASAYLVGPF